MRVPKPTLPAKVSAPVSEVPIVGNRPLIANLAAPLRFQPPNLFILLFCNQSSNSATRETSRWMALSNNHRALRRDTA